jgi:hypothetical protein
MVPPELELQGVFLIKHANRDNCYEHQRGGVGLISWSKVRQQRPDGVTPRTSPGAASALGGILSSYDGH